MNALSNRRRYLTQGELDKLIKAARKGRFGQRDATLILLMARHGLRVTEAIDLHWDQVDFARCSKLPGNGQACPMLTRTCFGTPAATC
jgi:integrase